MGEFYSKKSCFASFLLICIYLGLSTSLAFAQTTKPSRSKLPKQFSQSLAKPSQTQQIKTLNPNNLEKEAYRIWLDWHQARKQSKNLAIPQFSVPAGLDKVEANRVLTIWEQAQTKAYWTVEEEEMYKVWLEYCRDQQQGITTEMPTLTHPPDARLEQQNQALTHWQRAESRAKHTVEKEASNRTKPSDQIQAQQASNITESNSLPNVVIDDETRQKAARSIPPLLDVPTSQPTSGFNQVVFNQSKGIAGVFSYSGNSSQPSQLQPNSPEVVMANNNQLLAEMNAETMKAKKLVNIETAKHLVDNHDNQQRQTNLNPITSSGSQLVRRFAYGAQGPISMSQLINGQWVTSYFIYDGEGNIRALTDTNGNVTDTFDYDAFGNLINRTGDTPNNRLYHGEEWDPDLRMYYNRARYLNVGTGRFLTMDMYEGNTFVPKSFHKYIYAQNNPVNGRDPSGFFTIATSAASILTGITLLTGSTYPISASSFVPDIFGPAHVVIPSNPAPIPGVGIGTNYEVEIYPLSKPSTEYAVVQFIQGSALIDLQTPSTGLFQDQKNRPLSFPNYTVDTPTLYRAEYTAVEYRYQKIVVSDDPFIKPKDGIVNHNAVASVALNFRIDVFRKSDPPFKFFQGPNQFTPVRAVETTSTKPVTSVNWDFTFHGIIPGISQPIQN